ncbi:MAG: PQQ-binding-like beta-propeller repeat protein [Candidatus Bathyarchaeia archaeon]
MVNQVVKRAIGVFSLILMLALLSFVVTVPAQVGVPQPVKTTGYISIAPTLIGVGQEATVNLWVFPLPTNYLYRPYYGGFRDITVTFVKPDGTEHTFKPTDATGVYAPGQTQAIGGIYFYYKPDMVGNWSVYFRMPEQNITDSTGTVIYSACISNRAYFKVQAEPVNAGLLNGYPWSPLPNDNVFWSYPISSNNREWSQISGDWLQGDSGAAAWSPLFLGATSKLWQPYGSGPATAHILWSKPIKAGGLIGGEYGSLSYHSITVRGRSQVVIAGKVFVNFPDANQFACFDLVTGSEIYRANGSISIGIRLPGNPFAQATLDPSVVLASSFGAMPRIYLFGAAAGRWNYYDPFTGALVRSIANATTTGFMLVDGTELAYGISGGRLYMWNMSKVVGDNWPTGFQWTVPLPQTLLGPPVGLFAPSLLGMTKDASKIVLNTVNQYWCYNSKDGTLLWNFTIDYPSMRNSQYALYGVDVFIVYNTRDATFKCYSMDTGSLRWESQSFSDSPWATTWNVYGSITNDNNNMYVLFPDGAIKAFNLANGKEIWRSEPIPSTEFIHNVVPFYHGVVLVGGNLYAYAGYSLSYQINPIPRFAMLVCLNATTGVIQWTLNGGIFPSAASNGYLLGQGNYDGKLYVLGKGPTKTTVMISPKIAPLCSSVLIEGSVIDVSPATESYEAKVRFPNGVPAVADEDMSEFMDYLYMQNATLLNNPPSPKGVTVRLSVIDPNNNCYEIGSVTTDSNGLYKFTWTPEIEGEYTIIATFDGNNSYWSSYAITALSMTKTEATESASPQGPAPMPSDNTALLYGILVVVIVTLAISLIALFKKR